MVHGLAWRPGLHGTGNQRVHTERPSSLRLRPTAAAALPSQPAHANELPSRMVAPPPPGHGAQRPRKPAPRFRGGTRALRAGELPREKAAAAPRFRGGTRALRAGELPREKAAAAPRFRGGTRALRAGELPREKAAAAPRFRGGTRALRAGELPREKAAAAPRFRGGSRALRAGELPREKAAAPFFFSFQDVTSEMKTSSREAGAKRDWGLGGLGTRAAPSPWGTWQAHRLRALAWPGTWVG